MGETETITEEPEIRPDVLSSYYLMDRQAWAVTRQYWVSHTTLESLGIASLTVKDRRKNSTGERMILDKHLPRCLEPRRGKWKVSRRKPFLDPRDRFGWDYFDYDVCPNELIFPCGGPDQLKKSIAEDWRIANETGALAKWKRIGEAKKKKEEEKVKKAMEKTAVIKKLADVAKKKADAAAADGKKKAADAKKKADAAADDDKKKLMLPQKKADAAAADDGKRKADAAKEQPPLLKQKTEVQNIFSEDIKTVGKKLKEQRLLLQNLKDVDYKDDDDDDNDDDDDDDDNDDQQQFARNTADTDEPISSKNKFEMRRQGMVFQKQEVAPSIVLVLMMKMKPAAKGDFMAKFFEFLKPNVDEQKILVCNYDDCRTILCPTPPHSAPP